MNPHAPIRSLLPKGALAPFEAALQESTWHE